MSLAINKRKLEHIRVITEDEAVDRRMNYFDEIRLTHRALPEIDLESVDPSVEIMGKKLSFPLLISSMTGGDHELVKTINRNLAIAAQTCSVAMAVGSQRVMFTNAKARSSFMLREFAPTALLFSNIGAIQLNCNFTLEMCQEVISVLAADALTLHLNPLQEAIQPEGNTNFHGLSRKIGELASSLNHPIILKEVGCGISPADVELVLNYGIEYFDVAGAGGTSWSRIEHHRQTAAEQAQGLGITFQDWGIPTPAAIRSLASYGERIKIFASGGIRTGIEMAKAAVLGATLCGMASPFLEPAMRSSAEVIDVIMRLKKEFMMAMYLLGISDFRALRGNTALVQRQLLVR